MTPIAHNQPLRVLLVEDDEVDIENVRRAFAENQPVPELTIARDGRQALDMLTSGQVSTDSLMILLDLNMPRMTGIEFLRELRNSDTLKHLPVVILTTSDAERDKVGAYDLNVAGYILKPITLRDFITTLDTVESYWRLQEFP